MNLLEWSKSKTMATPSADKVEEARNSPLLLVGMQNDIVILEDSLGGLQK